MTQRGETAPFKKTIPSAKILYFQYLLLLAFLLLLVSAGVRGLGTEPGTEEEGAMLWALGMFTAYTAGGLLHLLLVIALIVVVVQFIGGRRSA